MGTYVSGYLSPAEVAQAKAASSNMAQVGAGGTATPAKFVFLAAFDGTNNDRNNLKLSGSPNQTNVANIYDQAKLASEGNPNFKTAYYKGVGTGGDDGGLLNAAITPTKAVHNAAERAYKDFAKQASDYLIAHKDDVPPPTPADISASVVGFSRGTATGVVFAQMLNERGLVLESGTVVAPPGVAIRGMALLDPVHTFVEGDMRIPLNVQGEVLVVRAVDEFRRDFKAVDYSEDSRVKTVEMFGNHCGTGGGDDLNGTASLVLAGTTSYLQNSGAKIAEVPPTLQFNESERVALRTEVNQLARNGEVLTNSGGEIITDSPRLVWRVEGERGSRGTVELPPPDYQPGGESGSDAHFNHYPPPAANTPPSPTSSTTPVVYETVEIGGNTYTFGPNGTLDRPIPGQPGFVESRDSTGGGIIFDPSGHAVAVLQPGDRVGKTDDYGVTIHDDNGIAVDRRTEEAGAGVFAVPNQSQPDIGPDGSDAHFLNHPAPTTPETSVVPIEHNLDALTDIDTLFTTPGIQLLASTDTLGTTGFGQTLPTDDGFTLNQPPAPVNADTPATTIAAPKTPEQVFADRLLDAQYTDAASALSFANSIVGLRNWGSQDGLARLNTVVNLYNQFDRLGSAVNGVNNGGTGSDGGPGFMGQAGAGLNFVISLKSGNPISIASSTGSFINAVTNSTIIPIPALQGLNILGALQSGNPISIASSILSIVPGWGQVAGVVLSILGGAGKPSIPPPPDGAVHYTWDENGAITIQTEHNVSGGAQSASNTAGNVLGLLNSVATAQNDKNNAAGQSQHNVAIDPSRMPRIGHTAGQNWLEVTHPDGTTTKETIDPATIGKRMVEIAVENGALAPVWQIDTARAHAVAQAQAQQQAQADATHATQVWDANAIDGDNRPAPTAPASSLLDIDGRAPVAQASAAPANTHNNPTVFGTTGTGVESADHKTISYGALVVHLGTPGAQQAINALQTSNNATPAATNTALSDTDGDGFFEQTQWVAGQDSQGNVQGMLVLDRNNNGLIETADILHMGGDGNQRNSMNWLDSNGDGKLDASDPAFAAIKLFVDLNNNGRVDDGEMQGTGLSSINFTTGQVNYSNGTSDALTVTTLTAETEGSKVEKIKVVGEDGKLYELNAGSVIVHEGYQGLVRVNNKGEIVADDDPAADNRWVQQRINSYTFNAAHQSDWEGTDKQDQHRHGGKNVEGAPTETSATGATSKGPVLGKENVKTYTTMDVGDKRLVSDAPRTSADVGNTNTAPTTITLNAGDARIRSLTPPADQAARVVFVPSGVREGWMTADGKQLLHMPDDGLFGAGGTGSALTAVALGAVQTTAFSTSVIARRSLYDR